MFPGWYGHLIFLFFQEVIASAEHVEQREVTENEVIILLTLADFSA
jgi:hypothetical protein